MPPPKVSREQILAFRRRTGSLDERLPSGSASLARAAWAGLQDSVPRSALHSLHARVEGIGPDAWEDPSLVQVWGLRYTAYVVPAGDHAPFTVGRLPDSGSTRQRAEDLAARLHAYLDGRRLLELCHSFVQPARRAPVRHQVDERMCELVFEHTSQV